MAYFSHIIQHGCVAPPEKFTNLTPGTMVELHGWFDDDTPTGGAVGVVTKLGARADTAWVRFVGAESGFWDWHLRFSNPNQPVLVQLYRPDVETIVAELIEKWCEIDPKKLPSYLKDKDGDEALKLLDLVKDLVAKETGVQAQVLGTATSPFTNFLFRVLTRSGYRNL